MEFKNIKETKFFRLWLVSILLLFFYVFVASDIYSGMTISSNVLPTSILDLVIHTHNFLLMTVFTEKLTNLIGLNISYSIVSALSYSLIYFLFSVIIFYCYVFVKNGK